MRRNNVAWPFAIAPITVKSGIAAAMLLSNAWADQTLAPLQPLFDQPVRDTSICVCPDGTYYLTGTTASHAAGQEDTNGWWYVNEGIRLWKSRDLRHWESLGLVWSLDKDATWAKAFKTYRGVRARAVWAPEIHYLKGTFWLPYCMNYRGCGLLKSVTGMPEGPYTDVKSDGPLTDHIDASLFPDDDGKVYWVYQNGMVARMSDDMTGLAEEPRLLKPQNAKQVGFEGAFLTKCNGKYVLLCADHNERDGIRAYDCMAAVADNIYGPYSDRFLAIPHAGHNMILKTPEGQWMSTFFGSDQQATFREKPGLLPIEFDGDGRFHPLRRTFTVLPAATPPSVQWKPAAGALQTRWAKDVSPTNALPEYPRPQLVRPHWLNLNGLWDFAICPQEEKQATNFESKILVPFPVESSLSGVQRTVTEKQRLWYHRTFAVPTEWRGQRILLNFGAVDWEASVTVNGIQAGTHRGGYDAFSCDITGALRGDGPQELVVSVWDPSDGGQQPNGKQYRKPPGATRYTATSGIWQTVWLEPVNQNHIRAVTITPDVDGGTARVVVDVANSSAACWIEAEVRESGVVQSRQTGKADEPIVLRIKHPKLWSPESPFLYDLKLTLKAQDGAMLDGLSSYFGMRKIDIATAPDGYQRIRLNNQFVFQLGFLDQGFWPDGLYTAPTDEALRFDIEAVRKLGCNMVRKHVKIEPQRWYYWCDKLGLLVWQDMVSGKNSETGRRLYEHELQLMIEQHFNHPSIVMWVNFNEGWGQFDTPRIYELVKKLDPTRLVNASSGGKSANSCGEVADMHHYPGPAAPVAGPRPSRQVAVLGEFGGLGLIAKDHVWAKLNQDKLRGNAAYRDQRTDRPRIVETPYGTGWEIPLNLDKDRMMRDWRQWDEETFIREYGGLLDFVPQLCMEKGLAAAVYTQLTDVENELNGLLTYDRIYKADPARFAPIHQHCLRQQLESLDTGK